MQIREIPPKPGEEVIVQEAYSSYFLPDDLPPGTKAKLLSLYYGTATVEHAGKTWKISDRCIKHEYEWQVGTKWYPANHPAVAQEKEREETLRRALENQPDIRELMK
jgi:hypothetical protein